MKTYNFSAGLLILPFLIALALFPSKGEFSSILLAEFFSWSLLITFSFIFVQNYKYKDHALFCILILTLFKISAEMTGNSTFDLIYRAIYVVVVFFAGSSMVLKNHTSLLRQMYWLSGLSIIISLLQIFGVLWAQELGSAISWKGAGNYPVLFQAYSEDFNPAMSQFRPDGFSHANNLTSQLLLFFYAYSYFFATFSTGLTKPVFRWLFIITFAGALTGGKVFVFGIFMINLFTFIFLRKDNIEKVFFSLILTLFAYLLYFLLFPGLFLINFNYQLFISNALDRIANIILLHDLNTFSLLIDSSILEASNSVDAISGLAYLSTLRNAPAFLFVAVVLFVLWLRALKTLKNDYIFNVRFLSIIMMVALISSLVGGPFCFTIWFFFFASIVSVPFTFRLLSERCFNLMRIPQSPSKI
jgi:hypothetical protein